MPDIFIDEDPEEIKPIPKDNLELKTEPDIEIPEEIKDAELKPAAISPKDKDALLDSLGIQKHGGGMHGFSSYFEDPSRVKFKNMVDEEILLLFLRRHFVTNIPWFIKAIAMGLIPVIFEFMSALGFYSNDFVSPLGKLIIYGFYYFFIFSGYIFVNYMTWFYNISLVTNIRIVDIDFSEVVFENVAATKLSQVEDVSYAQIGLLRSLFDYGDVYVQTAGSASNFEFLAVPHPENVIRIINNLLGKKNK